MKAWIISLIFFSLRQVLKVGAAAKGVRGAGEPVCLGAAGVVATAHPVVVIEVSAEDVEGVVDRAGEFQSVNKAGPFRI